jgi:hypothetical protein
MASRRAGTDAPCPSRLMEGHLATFCSELAATVCLAGCPGLGRKGNSSTPSPPPEQELQELFRLQQESFESFFAEG